MERASVYQYRTLLEYVINNIGSSRNTRNRDTSTRVIHLSFEGH